MYAVALRSHKPVCSMTLPRCHTVPWPDGKAQWQYMAYRLKINICSHHSALFREGEDFSFLFCSKIKPNIVRCILQCLPLFLPAGDWHSSIQGLEVCV